MLEHVLPTFLEILSGKSLMFLLLGSLLGLLFGLLPGLGGPQVLALLLPVTFTMDSHHAIILLMGAAGATALGGSVTAILLNTPGTAQNAATVYDGFPLTKQGKAGLAIGAATTASVLGAIFGAIVLTFILPVGRYIVLAFSYPEYFMMAVMGLAMIAVLSQGALWKSLLAGGVGLLLTLVGFDPVTGDMRYTFGTDYLLDGIKLIPALIGLFAVAEAIVLFSKKGSIASERVNTSVKGVTKGIKSVFANFGLFLRSSIIGTIIGIVPGVGGAVANFIAYGQAVSIAKDKENFGKGDIRGVIAPEASNNAKDGGSLVPTLIFGIPGSMEMAVLLGALTIHGVAAGPRLILDHGEVALLLIYALVFSNIIVGVICLLVASPLARLTSIKTTYIAPIILVLAIVGSYATAGMILDVVVTICFGIVGYMMIRYQFSRIALVIALVLGTMMESNFHLTMSRFGIEGFFTRPISLMLFIITVIMLFLPIITKMYKGRKLDKGRDIQG